MFRMFGRLRCSFCRRANKDVEKLVAGARGYICDRCAREVMRIIDSTPPATETTTAARPLARVRTSEWNRTWHFAEAGSD
jgi:ATP-dependent protease Clp ATPase subunit